MGTAFSDSIPNVSAPIEGEGPGEFLQPTRRRLELCRHRPERGLEGLGSFQPREDDAMIPGRPISPAIGIPLDDLGERIPVGLRALPPVPEGVSPELRKGRVLVQRPRTVLDRDHLLDEPQPLGEASWATRLEDAVGAWRSSRGSPFGTSGTATDRGSPARVGPTRDRSARRLPSRCPGVWQGSRRSPVLARPAG